LREKKLSSIEANAMTCMLEECLAAPAAVARQLAADHKAYAALGAALRAQPPSALLTVARGSSDHAAQYFAYLVMARMGRLVTSLPMSLVTLYQSKIACEGLVSLAFSQSGQSPDLVAPTKFFREGGARTVAFVNAPDSPLAAAAQFVFPLHAGPEQSVAATKSYIAQLVAGARVVAAWSEDDDLQAALQTLPQALQRAAALRWDVAVDALKNADRLFVIGRGLGLPIALEAALKFKETCGIQAEAFSGAEVKHGPMALVEAGYPPRRVCWPWPRRCVGAARACCSPHQRARRGRSWSSPPPAARTWTRSLRCRVFIRWWRPWRARVG